MKRLIKDILIYTVYDKGIQRCFAIAIARNNVALVLSNESERCVQVLQECSRLSRPQSERSSRHCCLIYSRYIGNIWTLLEYNRRRDRLDTVGSFI